MAAVQSAARRRALHVWAALVYWTGKAAGVLVAGTAAGPGGDAGRRDAFTAAAGGWRRWAGTRAWNVACLAAVAHRVHADTWPATVRATRLPRASCYDTVCGDVWCVYACVYYAVAWLDRASEACALIAAVTWRRRSTVRCLNSAAARCFDDDDDDDDYDDDRSDDDGPTAADVPWHAYLAVVFPAVQFAVAANAISLSRGGGWRAVVAVTGAVASCAPIAAHGTAVALLVVANSSMRSINHRIARLSSAARPRDRPGGGVYEGRPRLRAAAARLAHRHWRVAELVTGHVCGAYGVDFMTAVLMAAVRVTYVAVSVFHRLTDDSDAQTNMSLAVVMQLIAWFGQFAYLAYTCDELAAQSSEMFDNLNSLLLDIFEESRLSGETYSSKIQEIETVQEFMRQVVVRKVVVHACGGLITLNLSLITTIIGVTLTYFIVLLQFESSNSGIYNNTISQ